MTKPKLQFGPEVTPTGFAATATALFNDLRPARIIREILQNSLDAAADAGERVARVRFRVTMIGNEAVPDVTGYAKAFREAIRFGKDTRDELSTPDQQIVDQIEEALGRLADDNHYMLSVMDNGVGLDDKRMTAILGDGISSKSGQSAGSYGVGHFTAVPTSDLRYLLYGGVQSNGQRIAAGCAFLASRPGKRKHLRAAKGYLIKDFEPGQAGRAYDFIDTADIPLALDDDLRAVRGEWGHGTVIHIPAFNYFRDDGWSLWSIVSKVAAYNFVVAIQQGTLEVEVDEDAIYTERVGVQRLDRQTIEGILDDEAHRQRVARGDSFFAGLRPSGQAAHSIYQVLERSERHVVKTEFDDVPISLLVPSPTESTRVDLFRNGMWITDDLRHLSRSDFADRQSFHAVLMPEPGGELHRLIRKAEGPMHNELSPKHLDDNHEKDQLRAGLDAIRDWLRNHVPEIGTDEYTPDDFLLVDTDGGADGEGNRHFSMYGSPVVVQRANVRERLLSEEGEPTNHEGGDGKRRKRPRKRPPKKTREGLSRPLQFQSTVVPAGVGRHIVSLRCAATTAEVSLSLRLHENVDATCDRIWPDQIVHISGVRFRGEGQGRPSNADRGRHGEEVRIRGFVAGETYQVEIEHEAVEGLGGNAALRVVLQRPPTSEDT